MNTNNMNKIPGVNIREVFDKTCLKCKLPFRTKDKDQEFCAVCRRRVPIKFRRKTNRHYADKNS